MNTNQIPCTIRQIGVLTGEEDSVEALLILNNELYIHYEKHIFEEFEDTKSRFTADVNFQYNGAEYFFELKLITSDDEFVGFDIIPDNEYQELKTTLSSIELNSKITKNNKKNKPSKI